MTTPVLCKGIDTNGDILSLALKNDGSLNVSSSGGALATETTLASMNGKITSCDTSALATEATLASMNGKITACDTSALATEATVSAMSAKLPASLGQATAANSLSVVLSSDNNTVSMITATASSQDSLSVATASSDTSVSKDTAGYERAGIIVKSSASDTKAGLEWSHDNSTWFFVEQAQTVSSISPADGGTAQNSLYFKVGVLAKYFRVHVYNPDVATASVEVLVNLA